MNSPASAVTPPNFGALLKKIRIDFPTISLTVSNSFYWSAESNTIYYNRRDEHAIWSLFHELGHMIHGHNIYRSDSRLIQMEVEAWNSAMTIAQRYGYEIDPEHVQDCLDSYRIWQHARSACPVCAQTGVEKSSGRYHCINCQHQWQVSENRFCRVYRQTKKPSRT